MISRWSLLVIIVYTTTSTGTTTTTSSSASASAAAATATTTTTTAAAAATTATTTSTAASATRNHYIPRQQGPQKKSQRVVCASVQDLRRRAVQCHAPRVRDPAATTTAEVVVVVATVKACVLLKQLRAHRHQVVGVLGHDDVIVRLQRGSHGGNSAPASRTP